MCARRFLAVVVRPDPARRRRRVRDLPVRRPGADQEAMPTGHFEAGNGRQRTGLFGRRRIGSRGPDFANDPSAWLPDGHDARPSRRRGGLLHPPDDLSRTRPLERAARAWRRHRVPHAPFRSEPGERVQRSGAGLGAALSPGGLRRLPAEERRCGKRRSTSPTAMSLPRSTSSSRKPAIGRSSSPDTARARYSSSGCSGRRSRASRSRSGSSRLTSSAGRSARPRTWRRSACRPAGPTSRPAASSRG